MYRVRRPGLLELLPVARPRSVAVPGYVRHLSLAKPRHGFDRVNGITNARQSVLPVSWAASQYSLIGWRCYSKRRSTPPARRSSRDPDEDDVFEEEPTDSKVDSPTWKLRQKIAEKLRSAYAASRGNMFQKSAAADESEDYSRESQEEVEESEDVSEDYLKEEIFKLERYIAAYVQKQKREGKEVNISTLFAVQEDLDCEGVEPDDALEDYQEEEKITSLSPLLPRYHELRRIRKKQLREEFLAQNRPGAPIKDDEDYKTRPLISLADLAQLEVYRISKLPAEQRPAMLGQYQMKLEDVELPTYSMPPPPEDMGEHYEPTRQEFERIVRAIGSARSIPPSRRKEAVDIALKVWQDFLDENWDAEDFQGEYENEEVQTLLRAQALQALQKSEQFSPDDSDEEYFEDENWDGDELDFDSDEDVDDLDDIDGKKDKSDDFEDPQGHYWEDDDEDDEITDETAGHKHTEKEEEADEAYEAYLRYQAEERARAQEEALQEFTTEMDEEKRRAILARREAFDVKAIGFPMRKNRYTRA